MKRWELLSVPVVSVPVPVPASMPAKANPIDTLMRAGWEPFAVSPHYLAGATEDMIYLRRELPGSE